MFPYATRERAAANESWQLIWGIRNFLECVRSVEWSSGISLSRRQREREAERERKRKKDRAKMRRESERAEHWESCVFPFDFFGESRFHRHIVYTYDICSVLHFVHLSFLWFVLTRKLRVLDPKCVEYVLMLGNTQSSHLLSTNAPSQRHWPAATLIIDLV